MSDYECNCWQCLNLDIDGTFEAYGFDYGPEDDLDTDFPAEPEDMESGPKDQNYHVLRYQRHLWVMGISDDEMPF